MGVRVRKMHPVQMVAYRPLRSQPDRAWNCSEAFRHLGVEDRRFSGEGNSVKIGEHNEDDISLLRRGNWGERILE